MSDKAGLKGEFLEALYEKTRVPGSWKGAGEDRVETRFDDLHINLDRTECTDFTSYTVWVHGPDDLVEQICDLELTQVRPAVAPFDTYWALMHEMYWSATDITPVVDKLSDALSKIRGASGPSE